MSNDDDTANIRHDYYALLLLLHYERIVTYIMSRLFERYMPIVRYTVFVVMVLDDRCSGCSRVLRNSVAWGNTNFDPSPQSIKIHNCFIVENKIPR